MDKITNLHIYPSPLTNMSRIMREAKSLVRLCLVDEIYLIGYNEKNHPVKEKLSDKITIHRLSIKSNVNERKYFRYLSFIEFFFKAIIVSLKYKPSIINCHSLHVLPIGVLLKIFAKARLIYDAHELETEVKGAKGVLNLFIKFIEKVCIPFVDELIVVSDSIGDWYKDKYRLNRFTSVYNIPSVDTAVFNTDKLIFRKLFGLKDTDILFIYQGILSEPRGVDQILKTFQQASSHLHVVFMGDGPLVHVIKSATKKNKNIHYHPLVKPSDILIYTRGADVGIHIIKNTCLNHYYCLPNKIFEYLIAGIPFIVSDFPEMAKIVNSSNAGWLIEPNWKSLLHEIQNISIEDIKIKKQNLQFVKPNFTWEAEELKYISVYQRVKERL